MRQLREGRPPRRLPDQDSMVVTMGQVVVSLPIVIAFALFEPRPDLAALEFMDWFSIAWAGLVGSYLGYLLLFVLLKRYGATSGALPGYVIPVISMLLGAVLLDEVITAPLIIGALLVLAGVFLVSSNNMPIPTPVPEPGSK